jgi:hypothetical protein
MTVSAMRPESPEPWLDWLKSTVTARRGGAELNPSVQPDGVALHS